MADARMKAAVLTGHGGLEVVEVVDNLPVPEPGRDEVRVNIKAAAVNRLDLFVRAGWRGLHLDFPHIMCADGAGIVDAVGEGVSTFVAGDRVAIDPTLVDPNDPALMTGLENQSRIKLMGEHAPGVAAEYVIIPSRNLLKMPDDFSFVGAAAAGLVYVTAWHSMITRGGLRPGETVLIVGAGGGVNSASIQIAKLAGAKVYVVGSSAEKCEQAKQLGADIMINREEEPQWSKAVYQMTEKRGVDIVVDKVGQATFNDSIRSTRSGGRMLVVGGTSGPSVDLDVRQIFARQISIIGSTMGPHQDYVSVMKLIFDGALHPVVGKVFPLEEAREAQQTLADFDVFGKVVLDLQA
jgi:NADPH:quinone reductase-like Zn-dependent oxidoreductase